MTDAQIRLTIFVGTFLVMLLVETLLPRRKRVESRSRRTAHNVLLVVLNSAILRSIPLLSAMSAAYFALERGWGLLNQFPLPSTTKTIVAIVALDLVIYWQHVLAHRVPLFWNFHKVHHADRDLDASSGLRFHPVEIVASMVVKIAAVLAVGASPTSVLLFEIVLSSCSIFNHSNVALPLWLDRILRCLLVTPDMHRIHHSIRPEETGSNFGFNIPLWDRIFGTYRRDPVDEHQSLRLGLPSREFEAHSVSLWDMLRMPFVKSPQSKRQKPHEMSKPP